MRILALIIFCLPCFAQAVRVKAERIEGGATITAWGTAWVSGKGCVTCFHVVDKGVVFVESGDGWIKCAVALKDAGADLALLRPNIPIAVLRDKDADGKLYCFAAPLGNPVKRIPATFTASILLGEHLAIEGFDSGASGSPIMRDGALIGICIGQCGLSGKPVKDTARIVSAEMVKRFLEKGD